MDLQEALKQLDPENESHWSTQGKPMVDIAKALAEDDSVTRALIEEAAPGLLRGKFNDYEWPEVGADPVTHEEPSGIEALRQELAALEVEYNDKNAEADKCRQERDTIKGEMEQIDARMTAMVPDSFAQSNSRYLETMAANRAARAERGDPRTDLDKALQAVNPRPSAASS